MNNFNKFLKSLDIKREISGYEMIAVVDIAFKAALDSVEVDKDAVKELRSSIKAGVLHVFGNDDIYDVLKEKVNEERNSEKLNAIITVMRMIDDTFGGTVHVD